MKSDCLCDKCRYKNVRTIKYGLYHMDACVCDHCVINYEEHNRRQTCECVDCVAHRNAIYQNHNMRYRNAGRRKVASINLCERCGSMMKSTAAGTIQVSRYEYDQKGRDVQEICPPCVGDLIAFMAGEAVKPLSETERLKSYTEPWQEPKSPVDGISAEELLAALRKLGEDAVKELGT